MPIANYTQNPALRPTVLVQAALKNVYRPELPPARPDATEQDVARERELDAVPRFLRRRPCYAPDFRNRTADLRNGHFDRQERTSGRRGTEGDDCQNAIGRKPVGGVIFRPDQEHVRGIV